MMNSATSLRESLLCVMVVLLGSEFVMGQMPDMQDPKTAFEEKQKWLLNRIVEYQSPFRNSMLSIQGSATFQTDALPRGSRFATFASFKAVIGAEKYSLSVETDIGKTKRGWNGNRGVYISSIDGGPSRAVLDCREPSEVPLDPNLFSGVFYGIYGNLGSKKTFLEEYIANCTEVFGTQLDDLGPVIAARQLSEDSKYETVCYFKSDPIMHLVQYKRLGDSQAIGQDGSFFYIDIEYQQRNKTWLPKAMRRKIGRLKVVDEGGVQEEHILMLSNVRYDLMHAIEPIADASLLPEITDEMEYRSNCP